MLLKWEGIRSKYNEVPALFVAVIIIDNSFPDSVSFRLSISSRRWVLYEYE